MVIFTKINKELLVKQLYFRGKYGKIEKNSLCGEGSSPQFYKVGRNEHGKD